MGVSVDTPTIINPRLNDISIIFLGGVIPLKASELIQELQRAISEYGDMDILVRDCSDGFDWSGISVCPDPPSPMEIAEGIAGTIDINVFN